MNLYDIQHELIANRTADAWYRIMVAGPSFHYRWQYGSGSGVNFSYIQSEHHDHAVCRDEPSLTMSWGMAVHERDTEHDLRFEWASGFVNPTVRPFWVDFFWNNALIDRVELCRIDGGHGTIPIPGHDRTVSEFEVAVAFLIHGLEDQPEHDNPVRYLDSLDVRRVHDGDRWGAGSR